MDQRIARRHILQAEPAMPISAIQGAPIPDPAAAKNPLIRISGVEKLFGAGTPHVVQALTDIDIAIGEHEFFTLLGPSGCGKTTLLRMLAGFEHPTSGEIWLDGRDVAGTPPRDRPVNMVFQNYALFPHLSVGQNIAFGLEMLGWKKREVAEQVASMLSLVRLEGFRDRKPAQLSGGQAQRVALARALAPKPRVLLLDEPLSALDLKLRKEMQGELKRLQRETGITFVLVTHDQEEALAMSDRLAVMSAGRILQVGTPEEIYDRPATRFVAGFIGEANLLPAQEIGRTGTTIAIRPERVGIAPPEAARLRAEVRAKQFLGADTLVELATEAGTRIRARLRGAMAPEPGATVGLVWDDDAERVLHD